MAFSWEKYFSLMHIKGGLNRERWEEAIRRFAHQHSDVGNDVRYASQLLYLAYLDGHDANDHVTNLDYVQNKRLPADSNNEGYGAFTWHRDSLGRGLSYVGGELLRTGGGCQYLRTIRKYSGSMYVRFANAVSNIVRNSSWNKILEPEYLARHLEDALGQYFHDDEEGVQSKQDIVLFFQSIARQFRLYNQPVDPDDPIFSMVPPAVASRIIERMGLTPQSGEENACFDTLPTLGLNSAGAPVFILPQEGHFADGISNVTFVFSDVSGSVLASLSYRRRQDGSFILNGADEFADGVPMVGVAGIVRRRNALEEERQEGLQTVEEDVMPLYLKDSATRHVLVALRTIETGCGYALDETVGKGGIVSSKSKLTGGLRYKVISFDGEVIPLAVLIDDTRTELAQNDQEIYLREGVFTLPMDADALEVGETSYICQNRANEYINDNVRSMTAADGSRQRLYFDLTSYPFTAEFDHARSDAEVQVWYEYVSGGVRQELCLPTEASDWDLPEECLWQKGWMSFRKSDGTTLCRRAVTFIDEPWVLELDQMYDSDSEIQLTACIAREQIQVVVPPRMGSLIFEYRGIRFSFPVKRAGVCFNCSGHLLSIARDTVENPRETFVAKRDFEKTCTIMADDEDHVFATRGMESIALIEGRTVTGLQLQGLPQLANESSDCYTFCIGHTVDMECYRFQVYDPMRAYANEQEQRRVSISRSGQDLVLKYCIAYCDKDIKKSLAYYPAHRQDQPVVWLDDVECAVAHERDAKGRCIEQLTLPGFYDRTIDWGEGLLCYVGRRIPVSDSLGYNIETFTAGFFLCRPEGVPMEEIGDDPYGLRLAMARKDFNAIDGILSIRPADDAKLRWLTAFLSNLNRESGRVKAACVNGKKEPARQFMNAFHNTLKAYNGAPEVSGYSFSAWWYHLPRLDAKGRLPQTARNCWSPLMFPSKELFAAGRGPQGADVAVPTCAQLHNLTLREKRILRRLVETVNRRDAQVGEMRFYERSFNYVVCSEAMRRQVAERRSFQDLLNRTNNPTAQGPGTRFLSSLYSVWRRIIAREGLDSEFARCVRHANQSECPGLRPYLPHGAAACVRIALDRYAGVQYPIYAGYGFNLAFPANAGDDFIHEKGLSDNDIELFVRRIADALSRWRSRPSLVSAQNIREILLLLKNFDDSLRNLFVNGALAVEDGSVPSFLGHINMLSWQHTLRNQNN